MQWFYLDYTKRAPYVDKIQMSAQTFYVECADVLNVLIKSATATHVFPFILPT